MNETCAIIISIVGGYLLGSIPFGLVLVKMAGLGDIRQIGSKNIGATNVLRTGRKDLALLTVLLDMSKAGIAAFIALLVFDSELISLAAGTAAIFGHNFPVWLKFKGGKGVASTFGLLAATAFPVGLMSGATWILTACVTRYSSLSALLAMGLAPLYALLLHRNLPAAFYLVIAVLIFIRHKDNIKRLLNGEESKISFHKKSSEHTDNPDTLKSEN